MNNIYAKSLLSTLKPGEFTGRCLSEESHDQE